AEPTSELDSHSLPDALPISFNLDDDPGDGTLPNSQTFTLTAADFAGQASKSASVVEDLTGVPADWGLATLSCTGDTQAQTDVATMAAAHACNPGAYGTCMPS